MHDLSPTQQALRRVLQESIRGLLAAGRNHDNGAGDFFRYTLKHAPQAAVHWSPELTALIFAQEFRAHTLDLVAAVTYAPTHHELPQFVEALTDVIDATERASRLLAHPSITPSIDDRLLAVRQQLHRIDECVTSDDRGLLVELPQLLTQLERASDQLLYTVEQVHTMRQSAPVLQ